MVDPLLCAVFCVLAAVAFNWWYRSRKLNIRYNDLYVLITGCDSGELIVLVPYRPQSLSYLSNRVYHTQI